MNFEISTLNLHLRQHCSVIILAFICRPPSLEVAHMWKQPLDGDAGARYAWAMHATTGNWSAYSYASCYINDWHVAINELTFHHASGASRSQELEPRQSWRTSESRAHVNQFRSFIPKSALPNLLSGLSHGRTVIILSRFCITPSNFGEILSGFRLKRQKSQKIAKKSWKLLLGVQWAIIH